jgi:hypothetical protein
VILFSPKGDLLVALSGDPGKPDFDIVEAIHFDPKTASFATSKFVLPAATERDPRLKDAARTNGEFNRGECTTCHGKDPRPIFDGYGLWPGFYGSRADTLSLHPAERRNYVAFLAAGSKSAQAPYRWLERPGAGETRPYLDLPAFPGQNPSLEYLPNTRLGIALTELNRQRIFRQIRSSPRYESLKYALTSGLLGCEPIPLSRRREKQVTQLLESENKARLKRGGIAARAEGSELFFLQELQAPLRRAVAEIVYVADVLEVDRTQWSMAFESGSLAFYDGVLNGSEQLYVKRDFLSEMLDDLARDDRRTAEALRGGWDLCGVLRDQIRTGASLPDLK